MNKLLPGILLLSAGFFSSMLLAAPGEWWEITAKMDMQGMPFPMPAQTTKICMPKGGQADPANTQGKDRNCKMTDVKHSGNTVKFKGSCVNQGETMNMEGETSHDDNSFKSNVKMSGKSQGKNMNMAMVSNGKRIGGVCDTEEQGKKVKAQLDAGWQQRVTPPPSKRLTGYPPQPCLSDPIRHVRAKKMPCAKCCAMTCPMMCRHFRR